MLFFFELLLISFYPFAKISSAFLSSGVLWESKLYPIKETEIYISVELLLVMLLDFGRVQDNINCKR